MQSQIRISAVRVCKRKHVSFRHFIKYWKSRIKNNHESHIQTDNHTLKLRLVVDKDQKRKRKIIVKSKIQLGSIHS